MSGKRQLLTALAVSIVALVGGAASARSQTASYQGTVTLDIKGYGTAKLFRGFRKSLPAWIGSMRNAHGTLICEAPVQALSCTGAQLPTNRGRVVLIEKPYKEVKFTGWHGACTGKKPECVIDMAKVHVSPFGQRNVHVGASFIPVAPGSRNHPIPIGTTVDVGGGLRVRINSTAKLPLSPPPPPGADYFDADVTAMNAGTAPRTVGGWTAWSKHNALYNISPPYFDGACPPSEPTPELDPYALISPGQSTTGHLCWIVAANDADSLELIFGTGYPLPPLWVSLH